MKSALILSVVVMMACFVLSFSSLDADSDNNNIIVRFETMLSGNRKLGSCAQQGEICGIKLCCEGLDCHGRYGCQPHCAKLGEMCGLIPCCEGLLCYGREGCVLPAVIEAKESLNQLMVVSEPESNKCLHRGEMCGVLPNVCCEGLECDGRKGCQPSCAKLGEICGLKPCCEGLLCKGRWGCQLPLVEAKKSMKPLKHIPGQCSRRGQGCGPHMLCCSGLYCDDNICQPNSCATLGEICGLKPCCEGLLCKGRWGCQLPIEANENLNDISITNIYVGGESNPGSAAA